MYNYKSLSNVPPTARDKVLLLLSEGIKPCDMQFAVYDVEEKHLLCASDMGNPRDIERKYSIANFEDLEDDDALNGRYALLCFVERNGDVFLLDAVDDINVTAAIMLVALNTIIGSDASLTRCTQSLVQPRRPNGQFAKREEGQSELAKQAGVLTTQGEEAVKGIRRFGFTKYI